MEPQAHDAGLVTLLFTDLVGSTELAQRLGESAAEEFRRLHFGLLRAAVGAHEGREVKNLGDGLMVAFTSATAALRAAVAMQRAVADHNRSGVGPEFAVRIGLETGDPVLEDGDYFGTPVIVAKRLCDRACAAQILSTTLVAELVGAEAGVPLRPIGPLGLKGLREPVATVEALWDGVARTPEAEARTVSVVRPTSLTPPPDPFVGREHDLAALADLLQRNRLVTVVGPGGVGKTRLSGHLVDAVATRYPDGVWCCALASVPADSLVAEAVATTLRVERRAGAELLARVVEFLAPKRALLVLDNCEQVVEGAAELAAAVLAGTASVDIVATTREALGIPGERRVPLVPLGLEEQPGGSPAPAVALFLERTAAMGQQVAAEDLPAVQQLCRRLDGLPLAIELAAAQVGGRTIAEILDDVSERLVALSVRRGRAERHRSIHALVDWSYDLLDEADRRLFASMAVFAGGTQAEGVAAVTSLQPRTVVDRLQGLAERSMVVTRVHDGVTRYALLEPVRAYAGLRLSEGDLHIARDAHAAFFTGLAETLAEDVRVGEDGGWAVRLREEMPNLRAAHGWMLERGTADASLRLARAMFWSGWFGMVSEVHAWAEQAAEAFADSGDPALPGAWATAACGAWMRGDLSRAEVFAQRGFAAERSSTRRCPELGQIAGNIAIHGGDFDRAVELYLATADAAEQVGDGLGVVCAVGCAAMAHAYAGRSQDALPLAERVLTLTEEHRGAVVRSMGYYMAGEAQLDTAPATAAGLLERCVEISVEAGNSFNVGTAGLSLLGVRARLGDPGTALPRYPDLLEHWQRAGAWNQLWLTLRNLVQALACTGNSEPAAVLHGAMIASENSTPISGSDAVRLSAVLESLRESLGDDVVAKHQERGAGLGDVAALAYARSVLTTILNE